MNQNTDIIDGDGVVLSGVEAQAATSMVTGLAKAEINQQIETAHDHPRSITKVVESSMTLATLSEGAAAEMNYALPRGGKTLTGPSIRLAELIFSQWGNCRGGARVVHVDRVEKYLEAEGVFHDLETNAATTKRVRRKISDKNGRLFNDDMITVAGNAACSIAFRNAVLAGIPKAAWMPAYEGALKVIKGDAQTLTERRERAFRTLGNFGVTQDMIFAALEVSGFEEITLEHLPIMSGWHTGLKNEETTVEALFGGGGTSDSPDGEKGEPDGKKGLSDKMAEAAGKGDDKKAKAKTKPKDEGKAKDDAKAEDKGDDDTGKDEAPEAPSEEDLEEAKDRGAAAAAKGRIRSKPPKDIAANPALLEAWEAAFDAEKEANQDSE